jgi:hypothetical protein
VRNKGSLVGTEDSEPFVAEHPHVHIAGFWDCTRSIPHAMINSHTRPIPLPPRCYLSTHALCRFRGLISRAQLRGECVSKRRATESEAKRGESEGGGEPLLLAPSGAVRPRHVLRCHPPCRSDLLKYRQSPRRQGHGGRKEKHTVSGA